MIKRIHIVGLPRSGTTALSKMVAERLGLPLASEPIFLWNDGFKIDLFNNDLQQEHRLSRVQEGLARLDRMFSRHGGYVEKTPSSALLAPYFYKIQRYAYIVLITRNRSAYWLVTRSRASVVLASSVSVPSSRRPKRSGLIQLRQAVSPMSWRMREATRSQ